MSNPTRTNQHPAVSERVLGADLSRRALCRTLFAAASSAVLFGLPTAARAADATAATKQALADAQKQCDQIQSQMDSISKEFESLSVRQDKTISQIEDVQGKIDRAQEAIDEKQAELDEKREGLSARVSSNYKAGTNEMLALLLSSSSFNDLISNAYYVNKINESDQAAIEEVEGIQRELERQKGDLEAQKSQLEDLKATQSGQLEQMKAKKDEVQSLLDNASSQVKQLLAKRDAEIVAAAQAEAAARAAASASSSGGSGSAGVTPGVSESVAGAGAQQRVVSAAASTPSPGAGLCAAWVCYVFENAGLGSVEGNADDMYNAWCTSSSKANLKVGMIIAVSSHPHTAAGRIYGHVGIYVGGNTVMDNIGYIRSIDVDEWIDFYGGTVTPRWGWANGINLAG